MFLGGVLNCLHEKTLILKVSLLRYALISKAVMTSVSKLNYAQNQWFSGTFGALRPEGRRFESYSMRHVGTLGISFTHSCLWGFSMFTPTQHQCSCRERL